MAQVRIASGRAFSTGLSYAKQVKGVYDPATKIWTLPDTPQVANMLAKSTYGFVPVGTTPAPTAPRTARGLSRPCPYCQTYCAGDCQ